MRENDRRNSRGERSENTPSRRQQSAKYTKTYSPASKGRATPAEEARPTVKRKKRKAPWKFVIGTLVLTAVCTVLIFAIIFMAWVNSSLKGRAEVYIDEFETAVSTELYYQDAETEEWVMYQTLFMDGEDRIWVSLDQIPDDLKKAAVAIEDKRFERHPGVDLKSTIRAIVYTLTGQSIQGGSTITQQTVKNVTGDNQDTVLRKVTEIYRALEMEKRYEKDEILEAYLNEIYMGQSCYGVETASLRYFGVHVDELSLAQCASLISITNNPSQFGPFEGEWSREQNRKRQLLVLDAMLDQEMISEAEYEAAVAEEVVFTNGYSNTGNHYGEAIVDTEALEEESKPQSTTSYTSRNSYFTDAVIEDVAQALMDEYGYNYETAINKVYGSGYKIYTTQNYDYQQIAEKVYEDLSNTPYTITKNDGTVEQLQGAMTIIDPYTGYVVAMVGGVGPKIYDRGLNWATTYRPCGSATKPISVYAPALDQGVITGASTVDDFPLWLLYTGDDEDDPLKEGTPWPKNDYSGFKGLSTIRKALVRSMNTCAVSVCNQLGVWESYDFMTSNLGFTTLIQDDATALGAMALGGYTNGVTTEEMAAAYAAFVNEGIYTKPRTFTRVEDTNGNVVLENDIDSHAAMKSSTAALMNSILTDVVSGGTGSGAYFSGMTIAGKTGSTNDLRDRYFVGYTPYYVGACWVGYESNARISSGGVNPAVALWKKVMEEIHQDLPNEKFFSCPDLVQVSVCSDSGMLATTLCETDPRGSRVRTEWVAVDNQPQELCTMHTGGHMLNYTRDYFVNFPDVVAEDSEYVSWGEPIGTPLDGVLWPGTGFDEDEGGYFDVDEWGNPIWVPGTPATPDSGTVGDDPQSGNTTGGNNGESGYQGGGNASAPETSPDLSDFIS